MNRRKFLKFSAATGLAAVAPVGLIFDYRDGETRMIDYIMTTYNDEIAVIEMIKCYSYSVAKGGVAAFLMAFTKRQPNVIGWLKSRIQFVGPDRICTNERYVEAKNDRSIRQRWAKEWNDNVAPRFGYEPIKLFLS